MNTDILYVVNVVFEKIFNSYFSFFLFFFTAIGDVKNSLKIGDVKHILSNISEIIKNT